MYISDPDFSFRRKDGQTGQPEVVQEVLADLKTTKCIGIKGELLSHR